MNTNALNQPDYLDIVFQNRNKAYGGYQLRRTYGQRVGKAMFLLYGTLAALAGYAMVPAHKTDAVGVVKPDQTVCVITKVELKRPALPTPPAPPTPPKTPPAAPNTAHLTKPVIVNTTIEDEEYMARQANMTNAVAGTSTNTSGIDGNANVSTVGNTDNSNVAVVTDPKPTLPPVYVEMMPEFNGNIGNWLAAHLSYPQVARDAGIEGRVVLQFIVNEDGSISDATVLKGIGGGCDDEALRVVKQMPHWKAGKQNGKAVKVLFRLPIVFTLQ